MSFTLDSKNSTALTADSRQAVATLTLDTKQTFDYLWGASTLPWQLALPWQLSGTGQTLTLDTRS